MRNTTLDVTSLEVECDADGDSKVTCWCKCRTPKDIDDVIAWLQLSKTLMNQWREIREAEAPEQGT